MTESYQTTVEGKKYLLIVLTMCFNLLITLNTFGQSFNPVRTRWQFPDDGKPTAYAEWIARWNAEHSEFGGEIKYRSWKSKQAVLDSFIFGEDYVFFKGFVKHSDGNFCEELPPLTSFIVLLNGDDHKILTDDAPRWTFGEPNISGKGYYGIELGNFSNPEISVGDSFKVIFSSYLEERFEQGEHTDVIYSIPLLPGFPTTLQLQNAMIPLPPDSLKLIKEESFIKLCWEQKPGLSYTVSRRSLNDTLVLNFPRYLYEKIAAGIIDSCFIDTTIDINETYGYILFAKNIASGLVSGRSREISERENLIEVRAIIVQPELYVAIEINLLQMVQDWEQEGAEVIVYSMQFPDPPALRDTLKSIKGLTGALLIGDLPVPWFQIYNDDDGSYQEYPIDLFYMDLDGKWQDIFHLGANGLENGPDGIYDTHTADFPRRTEIPDIVIGRITPTPGMGAPEEIINFYLNKCYLYRHDIGDIRKDFKALAYPDDDWHEWGNDVANDYISQVYPDYLCIHRINETTASDYEQRLDNNYSLIHVWVHSWPQGHAFKISDGNQNDYFYNNQILPANTNANFYLLFACGNSRYIEDKNCAAIYTFQTEAGINSIGSTHSGGMLEYNTFYPYLAQGISYGEAYLKTFQYVGVGKFDQGDKGWYYGLTFNGDPFIVPQPRTQTNIVPINGSFMPSKLELTNYPNPFSTGGGSENIFSVITYKLSAVSNVELTIYNALGQKVRTLVNKTQHRGNYKIMWDGKNSEGIKVNSGIYFCRIRTGKLVKVNKILLLK